VISEVQTDSGGTAITSDHWHIVHARYVFDGATRPYLRSVHSEYEDRTACRHAARALRVHLIAQEKDVAPEKRDEVFVRKPNFKSLKIARSGHQRPSESK